MHPGFAIALAGAVVLFAAPVHAQDSHGAIAVGKATDGESVAYGFAWNHAGKDEARAGALNACRAGGGENCVELAWFQNGCGSLAVDQHGNAQAKSAMTSDQAETRAIRTCEAAGGSGCTVVGSQCASPGGQAGSWSGSERVLAVPETSGNEQPTAEAEARDAPLSREQRIRVQQGLSALGFDAGPADGLFGRKTRAAIWDWQDAKGREATGYLTREEAEALSGSAAADEQASEESEAEAEPSEAGGKVVHFFTPECGIGADDNCWIATNNDKCNVWMHKFTDLLVEAWSSRPISAYAVDRELTWSGDCKDGMAHGKGVLIHKFKQPTILYVYPYQYTVGIPYALLKDYTEEEIRDAGNSLEEIPVATKESVEMIEGKRHGPANYQVSGSVLREGWRCSLFYMNGKRHGIRTCTGVCNHIRMLYTDDDKKYGISGDARKKRCLENHNPSKARYEHGEFVENIR